MSFEVPFKMSGNRRYLTLVQLHENPQLCEFVLRFRASFERDVIREVFWFIEPDV